jgi:hypothetical protein
MGHKEEARRDILKGLSMPNQEKDDPEMKAIGRETLKKLGYNPDEPAPSGGL